MIIHNTAEIARLSGGPQLPHLATTAQFEDGGLRLYTHTVKQPAPSWRTPDASTSFNSGTVGVFKEHSVGLVYLPEDQTAASGAAELVGYYLETTCVPHDIQGLPLGDNWSGIAVRLKRELPTLPVSIGPEGDLSTYVSVSSAEFAGSALWTVFRTLRTMYAANLNLARFQAGSHEPLIWKRSKQAA